MSRARPRWRGPATALVSLVALASCSGGTDLEVAVSGSSTVEPISTRAAERFDDTGAEAAVTVDGPGTGDGFAAFCAGESDVTGASRPVKDEELERCRAAGIEMIELKVAIDGLAVLTSAENDAVDCLNFADLYALVGPESSGWGSWSDAQGLARELGSDTDLPDAGLDITGPGQESGTFDSLVELAIEPIAEERGQDATTRPDYVAQSNDNAIIQGIEGSPSSLGWVGFAFAQEVGEGSRTIDVAADPGGPCVPATAESIASGDYPLSRDLFIYVSVPSLERNPAVADYVDFYLSDDGMAAVAEVGYVPLPPEELAATRAAWAERRTGSHVDTS